MLGSETDFLVAVKEDSEGDLIEEAISSLGFELVDVVQDGPSAFERLQTKNKCFVIASWELPQLGGLRLVRVIRHKLNAIDWPCVLILPEKHESEMLMAEGAGVNGFLIRPLTREKAAADIKKIIDQVESKSVAHVMESEADHLIEEGRLEEALLGYQKTLQASQERLASVHLNVGIIFKKQGKISEAIDHLERAALAQPQRANIQAALGLAFLEAGRPAEAGRAMQRALALEPENTRIMREFADKMLLAKQFKLAETFYNKLLTREPLDIHLLNRMGIVLRKLGKMDEAVVNYLQAIKVNDQDENLFFNLGRTYYETGQLDKSVNALNMALNLNPEMEKARDLLAIINRNP